MDAVEVERCAGLRRHTAELRVQQRIQLIGKNERAPRDADREQKEPADQPKQ
jgi:hypothetical protein